MRKNGDNRLNNSEISTTNRLLAALPDEELQRLIPNLERVSLALGEVIYEANVFGTSTFLIKIRWFP